jgi:hypothetical protein
MDPLAGVLVLADGSNPATVVKIRTRSTADGSCSVTETIAAIVHIRMAAVFSFNPASRS